MKKHMNKTEWMTILLIGILYIVITVCGIIFKQPFYRIIPLYFTLIVATLQIYGSRWASLIGGVNSVIYAIVYLVLGLYATALYWILVACPIQLIAFFRWRKRAYKHSTEFRKLTGKQMILMVVAFLAAYAVAYFFLSQSDSNYKFLDVASSVTGICSMLLMMFAFTDYTFFWLTNAVITIVLNALMMREYPGQITYLIMSVYQCFAAARAVKNLPALYREQQAVKAAG